MHRSKHKMITKKTCICDYCGKSFSNKTSVRVHLFTKHVKTKAKFECQICQKKFHLESLRNNHVTCVHKEKIRCITCEICGKSFYSNFHLKAHSITHSDKAERMAMRQQCEHCGEWLLTRSGINYHKQVGIQLNFK